MQNHITAVGLGYSHSDGSRLFRSLNFSFGPVRSGLIGQNGIGKSTLLEIVSGKRTSFEGSLTREGRVSYLAQTAECDTPSTVAEIIRLRTEIEAHERIAAGCPAAGDLALVEDRWDLLETIERLFESLGVSHISLVRRASSLSGGELTRIRLAALLLEEPDFLLLDEPTNHLDRPGREFIYELVARWRKGLIVVSHDRALLSLVDQIAELGPNGMEFYGGNFEFYREQRSIEREAAERAMMSARQRLKRAQTAAQEARQKQQSRQAAGHKRAARTGISKMAAGNLKRRGENTAARIGATHEKKVEGAMEDFEAARRNLPREHQIVIDLESSRVPDRKRIVEFIEVNFRYGGATRDVWSKPLSFEIVGPERVSLAGPNGSGKSTLIDLICGRKKPSAGIVRVGASRIGLLDQQVSVLDDSSTVLENLKRLAPFRAEHELRILLGRFLFYQDSVLKPASVLSGGERMRAGLACLLGVDQAPEILILDEPANNLDLASIEELTSSLRDFRGTLIVVSHDRELLADIGIDRQIELAL